LEATFRDIRLPSPTDIEGWRKEVMLPPWIVAHCHAVADLSRTFAGALRKHGIPVRTEALTAAGELHDLLRIVDLRPEAAPKGSPTPSSEEQACWEKWQTLFADLSHEEAVATFLRERGYAELGDIVAVHGLKLPSPLRATTEQKLLFYTDKRVKEDKVVSLEERFRDFRERYGKGKESDRTRVWYEEAQKLAPKPLAFLWIVDITEETRPIPISTFMLPDDSAPGPDDRFGAHQPAEQVRSATLYVTWFSGGLRAIDISNPYLPTEVGFYVPLPGRGQKTVQSNDVYHREDGLLFLIDRFDGLEILESQL